jgi:hypothetical protein
MAGLQAQTLLWPGRDDKGSALNEAPVSRFAVITSTDAV